MATSVLGTGLPIWFELAVLFGGGFALGGFFGQFGFASRADAVLEEDETEMKESVASAFESSPRKLVSRAAKERKDQEIMESVADTSAKMRKDSKKFKH